MTKSKTKLLQYNEEDVNALEHVSMLIDEYMCCNDDKLTESERELKKLVEDFYCQWENMIEKYMFKDNPKSPLDFVKVLEDAHQLTKGSTLQFNV